MKEGVKADLETTPKNDEGGDDVDYLRRSSDSMDLHHFAGNENVHPKVSEGEEQNGTEEGNDPGQIILVESFYWGSSDVSSCLVGHGVATVIIAAAAGAAVIVHDDMQHYQEHRFDAGRISVSQLFHERWNGVCEVSRGDKTIHQ